jgi:hypothetical protein
MAIGTVPRTGPTEVLPFEIRRLIAAQLAVDYHSSQPNDADGALGELVAHAARSFVDSAARTLEVGGGSVWEPLDATAGPDAVWEDLRPSEAIRLMELISGAEDRIVARCKQICEDELADAVATFALEHPDLIRATAR